MASKLPHSSKLVSLSVREEVGLLMNTAHPNFKFTRARIPLHLYTNHPILAQLKFLIFLTTYLSLVFVDKPKWVFISELTNHRYRRNNLDFTSRLNVVCTEYVA